MTRLTSIAIILFFPLGVYAQHQLVEQKVDSILAMMTLEEKIGQMNQYSSFYDVTGPVPENAFAKRKYDNIAAGRVGSMLNVTGAAEVRKMQQLAVENSRLGIPMIFGYDVIHGFRHISPIPLAEAASWDLEMIELSARRAAEEASAYGQNWTFAPMVDISRDARWGRVMEGAGEDPYLGSQVAVARVKGFQGNDLSAYNTIAACAKHYAAYGFAEAGRDYNTVDIGTATLYNTVLPPFFAAKEANARTFMNSFNTLNGIPATGNVLLQRKILKGAWEFDGFVVSDWGSIGEMIPHGFASDLKHAAELAVIAGSDMDMESNAYLRHLESLVEEGIVDEKLVDDAVRRILRVKFELGLFDDPYRYCDEKREAAFLDNPDLEKDLLEIAKRSIVLLKNERDLLPLEKSKKKIALIGPLAVDKTSPLGNWRALGEENSAISVLEGMQAYRGNKTEYRKGVDVFADRTAFSQEMVINMNDRNGMEEAVELARASDIVVMVLGEHGLQSGEGRSRASIGLPGLQQELLEKVFAVNKNIVLVLMNGRPLDITWAAENIPAIVESWHLGMMSGMAIAEVLYGDYNPSGKLPMSFPKAVGQVPIYYNHLNTGRPGPSPAVFWSHYTDVSNDPLYPFGYGKSYTSFEYSELKVSGDGDGVKVQVNVKNTGKRDGEEVVQLYIHDKVASVVRPVKELKGFQKIMIKAGESRLLSFTLTKDDLSFYDNEGNRIFEPGEFEIFVGTDSQSGLKAEFEL